MKLYITKVYGKHTVPGNVKVALSLTAVNVWTIALVQSLVRSLFWFVLAQGISVPMRRRMKVAGSEHHPNLDGIDRRNLEECLRLRRYIHDSEKRYIFQLSAFESNN